MATVSSDALLGDRIRFAFQFYELGTEDLMDPDEVQVIHRDRSGETVYTLADDPTIVIRDSLGTYHAKIRALNFGRNHFRANGLTEGNEKCIEAYLDIPESTFNEPLP